MPAEILRLVPCFRAGRVGIDHVGCRVTDQEENSSEKLHQCPKVNEQERQEVADGNLLEHADELYDDLAVPVGVEKDADGSEQQAPPRDVQELPTEGLSGPLREGEGHRDADDEHE